MRRTPTRRVEENVMHGDIPPKVEGVEPYPYGAHGDKVPIVKGGDDPPELSNRDIREALLALPLAVTTQMNLSMVARVNVVESTMTFRLRYFVRMNTPIFLGFKVVGIPKSL